MDTAKTMVASSDLTAPDLVQHILKYIFYGLGVVHGYPFLNVHKTQQTIYAITDVRGFESRKRVYGLKKRAVLILPVLEPCVASFLEYRKCESKIVSAAKPGP